MTSLAEFASANIAKPGAKCWACGIPQREEMEREYRNGVPMSIIEAWLKQVCGYTDVSRSRITNHLKQHVTK